MKKYYVAMAVDVDGLEQSDYLYMLKINGDALIGYASEFDMCTEDTVLACGDDTTHQAKWFGWDDKWNWEPATLEDIKAQGWDKVLIGYKSDMKFRTPIIPM